ncbi:MAG: trypsin-like peptidase domain-containing protein, partial [Planctomycetes bacterium]|nr:trypsin-like peptidase domain-containing protein [Planctomycetota bacterium]
TVSSPEDAEKTPFLWAFGVLVLLCLPLRAQDDEVQRLQKRVHDVIDKVKPAFVFVGGGSGVCVSPDGWILTNHHVAGGAAQWKVRFTGGREYDATLVGWHPSDDVALLKVRNGKDLPWVELGDSEAVRVGDRVIAVGNPFLLGNGSWEPTVTFGIVSALHIFLDNPGYKDAIQTDAQINPGNSGGPLIDMEGRVIGINGRIEIRRFMNRVNTGIGYAIPSHQINRFLPHFKAGGRVYGGYLEGVTVGECGDDRYENTGEYGDGVFVAGLIDESPSAKAGLELGDILIDIAGHKPYNLNRFHGIVGSWPAGSFVSMKVRRLAGESKEWAVHELRVLLGDPEKLRAQEAHVGTLDLGFLPAYDYDDLGVEVDEVAEKGPAAEAGLRPGDVIKKVGDARVRDWKDFKAALHGKKAGEPLRLVVLREERELEIDLVPRENEGGAPKE